jgi:multidrug resistance efflux pump
MTPWTAHHRLQALVKKNLSSQQELDAAAAAYARAEAALAMARAQVTQAQAQLDSDRTALHKALRAFRKFVTSYSRLCPRRECAIGSTAI